jgi:putative transposase
MHEWQNLSHVRWDCKYHIVIIPKYRRKVFYGRLRRQVGVILRELCRQRGIELVEGHAMPGSDHHENTLMGQRKVVKGPDFW